MADLPLHEASVGLLRHWGDERFAPHSIYFLNLGHANQLFSLLVFLLSFAMPIAWASKTTVAALLVALPVAAARFADYLGAPRWTVLLVAPIGIGWLFFWGLVQNILGLAALLALLPSIDRFAQRPSWRGASWMCAAMVLLHFAHQAMQLVACVALVLFCIGPPLRTKASALRAVPLVFCALVVYCASRYAWSVAGVREVNTDLFVFYEFSHKVTSIPGVLFGGYEPYVRNLMMLLALAPVLLLGLPRLRERTRATIPFAQRIHAVRFELLALVLFLTYLAAPANVKSTTLVYHRFLPPAWAILAIGVAQPRNKPIRPLAPVLCAALPIASLLIAWPTFVDSDHIYSALDCVIDRIDVGSAVLTLNVGPSPHNRLWNPVVAMGHVVATRGGRSLFDYSQSPVSPVAQRPEKQWGNLFDRVQVSPYELRPDWDFRQFRYLLLTTPRPTLAEAITLALKGAARLIAQKDDWYLFESELPVMPIDSDDVPLPTPHPPTLRRKLKDLAKELEAEDAAQTERPLQSP